MFLFNSNPMCIKPADVENYASQHTSYLIRWTNSVFRVSLKRYLWLYICIQSVLLGSIIVVECLLVVLFSKPSKVKFLIKGLMTSLNNTLSSPSYSIGLLSHSSNTFFAPLGMHWVKNKQIHNLISFLYYNKLEALKK